MPTFVLQVPWWFISLNWRYVHTRDRITFDSLNMNKTDLYLNIVSFFERQYISFSNFK